MRDPWVPPEVRDAATLAPVTKGAALRSQVEEKLKAGFDKADRRGAGMISRDEARAAGLGFIAEHFDAIDSRGAGLVTFEDFKAYLRQRGALLD